MCWCCCRSCCTSSVLSSLAFGNDEDVEDVDVENLDDDDDDDDGLPLLSSASMLLTVPVSSSLSPPGTSRWFVAVSFLLRLDLVSSSSTTTSPSVTMRVFWLDEFELACWLFDVRRFVWREPFIVLVVVPFVDVVTGFLVDEFCCNDRLDWPFVVVVVVVLFAGLDFVCL